MQEPTLLYQGELLAMETDERTRSPEPAGVMATACTHRRPEATREAPAEIAADSPSGTPFPLRVGYV
jgi:hypothetical protein